MAEKKIKNEIGREFMLVGIATSLKEYKLCFHLNNLLGCDFIKLKDIEFEPKDRTRTIQFSVFKAGNIEEEKNEYIVFANKAPGDYLLPEVSNFDYLLQINGKFDDEELRYLTDGIRTFPETVMVSEVPVKKVKNYERLVYG